MYDVLDYIGQHLLVPILVTLVAGALVASARLYFRVGEEVADNDARASELNEDLGRWVRDRNRQLESELRGLVNGAGNQLYAGSLRNKAHAAMRQALHEYRDEQPARHGSSRRSLARRADGINAIASVADSSRRRSGCVARNACTWVGGGSVRIS
jgi:hypothetical protein